jgi:hypothetical protein
VGSIKQNYANNVLSNGKFDATDLTGTIPNTNINDNSIDNVTSFPAAGSGIPSVASDPPSPSAGDVWYNTTSNAFKYLGVTTTGSWATGTSINTARYGGGASGIYTAALLAGGVDDTAKVAVTESWDGTSWTEVGDLNTARTYMGSSSNAPYTASLVFGGQTASNHTDTELWNGTSWTEVNDLNTARRQISGIGISTAALAPNGFAGAITNINESWNGTSWTEVADLNTSKTYRVGAGTQTAGIVCGGLPAGGNTETWNGSAWTEVNDMNTGRYAHGGGGTQTALLVYGGDPSPTVTEDWNGSSWTEVNDLNAGRDPYGQGTGTATNNLCIGGFAFPPAAAVSTVEEWTGAGSPVTKTVTTA